MPKNRLCFGKSRQVLEDSTPNPRLLRMGLGRMGTLPHVVTILHCYNFTSSLAYRFSLFVSLHNAIAIGTNPRF